MDNYYYIYICIYMCVCVWVREWEREREKESDISINNVNLGVVVGNKKQHFFKEINRDGFLHNPVDCLYDLLHWPMRLERNQYVSILRTVFSTKTSLRHTHVSFICQYLSIKLASQFASYINLWITNVYHFSATNKLFTDLC